MTGSFIRLQHPTYPCQPLPPVPLRSTGTSGRYWPASPSSRRLALFRRQMADWSTAGHLTPSPGWLPSSAHRAKSAQFKTMYEIRQTATDKCGNVIPILFAGVAYSERVAGAVVDMRSRSPQNLRRRQTGLV